MGSRVGLSSWVKNKERTQHYAHPSHHHRPTSEAGRSIPQNRYNASLPCDGSKPQNASTSEVLPQKDEHYPPKQKTRALFSSSPLPEDYNWGEYESCSSPPISKSTELHEAWREEIEGEKESNDPFIEAPRVYSGEWEREEDNVEGFEEAFVEIPEDILSMLMQEVQLLKERQILHYILKLPHEVPNIVFG
ncbi:unnamed protein product [Cuscuta epithymum]|uniref:Uncharacterized protein n=1 Tax=Cuscuta epithymum TaxID=186058 RepID=A0AAV0FFX2_9ASTE|nr:unnamed protein product [Cuscuta epithymum]